MFAKIHGHSRPIVDIQVGGQFGLPEVKANEENFFVEKRQAKTQIDGHEGLALAAFGRSDEDDLALTGSS